MATRQADGSIRMSDGRVIYANNLLLAQDFAELAQLFTPPPAWPFVSGGGGSPGPAGAPGPAGPAGPPGPAGAPAGAFQSIFRFAHISGSLSTGPLGFTPKFCIYSGVAIQFAASSQQASTFFTGFAFGASAADQAAAGLTADWDGTIVPTAVNGTVATGAPGAVGGADSFTTGVSFSPSSFFPNLTVSAFDASGITLTWAAPIRQHIGFLLVIG